MKVVGVGCGPGMLTLAAIKEISTAKRIYGSSRAIAIVKEHIPVDCHVMEIEDYSKLREIRDDSVVLSTGDPLLAGLGYLGGTIVPGISSMQVAFARLRLPLAGASVVVAHGTDHDMAISQAISELKAGKTIFVITDPGFDVNRLAKALLSNEMDLNIAVCQDLGYDSEKIVTGTSSCPPAAGSGLFCLVIGDLKSGAG